MIVFQPLIFRGYVSLRRVDLWYSFMSKCFLRCNSESVHLAFEKQQKSFLGMEFLKQQGSDFWKRKQVSSVLQGCPSMWMRWCPHDSGVQSPGNFLFAARVVVWGGFTQVWLPVSAGKILSRKFQVCSFKVFQVERLKEHGWLHNIIAPRKWYSLLAEWVKPLPWHRSLLFIANHLWLTGWRLIIVTPWLIFAWWWSGSQLQRTGERVFY